MAEPVVLYGRLVLARVRSQLQYRLSFALDTVAMFLVSFLDFVAVLLIFHATPRLGSFSVEEVAFLYATSGLSFAIAELVVGHLDGFPQMIRDGSFDVVLLRPRGTLFQVVSIDFQLRRLGLAVQAFVVLGWAIAQLDIPWNAGRVALDAALPARRYRGVDARDLRHVLALLYVLPGHRQPHPEARVAGRRF